MTPLLGLAGTAVLAASGAAWLFACARMRRRVRALLAAWAESTGFRPEAASGGARSEELQLLDHSEELKRRAARARALEVRVHVAEAAARRLQGILEMLHDGILVFEDGERLAHANATARRLLRAPDETVPSLAGALCAPALTAAIREVLCADLARGVRIRKVELEGAREGERALWRVRGLGECLRAGGPDRKERAVVLLEDVTFEEASARMKSEFVYGVSHELKTPLTAIQASLEMLDEDAERGEGTGGGAEPVALPPEDRRRLLRLAHGESVRLARMIQDLLDLARVEAGLAHVRRERVGARELLLELHEVHRPLAERKSIALQWTISPYVPALRGDPELLRRAFVNLIGNAIKYTPEGRRVDVRATLEGEELVVAIEDEGIGIGPADLPRIFDRFYRASQARSSRIPGTGLGLPLARTIVESHGGRIEVESTPGKGSLFRVHLPARSGAEAEPALQLAAAAGWEGGAA